MIHNNTLTDIFKEFAQCLNKTSLECTDNTYKIDSYTKARIILGRLYYACFHKGLEDFSLIRTSTAGKKHIKLLEALEKSTKQEHKQLYSLISKLYDLRVWADYEYDNKIYTKANPSNLGYYIFQLNLITSTK